MATKYRSLLLIGFIYLLAFSIAGLTTGCSTLQAINEPPKVDVKSVNVSKVGLKGIDLDVNLQVMNPNGTSLTIDKFVYNLSIGDSSLFNGVFNTPVELKAKDTTLVTIPIKLDYDNSKTAVENYVFRAVRNYKLKGSITSGLLTVPLDDEGKIEIKK